MGNPLGPKRLIFLFSDPCVIMSKILIRNVMITQTVQSHFLWLMVIHPRAFSKVMLTHQMQ